MTEFEKMYFLMRYRYLKEVTVIFYGYCTNVYSKNFNHVSHSSGEIKVIFN